jgi:Protein of unknown function (DUF1559)
MVTAPNDAEAGMLPKYPGSLAKRMRGDDDIVDEGVTTPENVRPRRGKSEGDDDDDDRPPPKKAKSGGGMGAGAIIGIVAGISAVLCCCGVGIGGALLIVPGLQKVRESAARVQSTNNLKFMVLGAHNYADKHRFLPYNGNGPAVPGKFDSGSWAFQILPFVDQAAYFNSQPTPTTVSIPTFMCPGRARSTAVTTGASIDYMYNLCLNDQGKGNSSSQTNNKMTLVAIGDGSSNTIFVGHGQISTGDYSKANISGFADTINIGGTFGTARGTKVNALPAAGAGPGPDFNFARDPSIAATVNAWGSPFAQGGLMAMCDGTVRSFPYSTVNLGAFLTPNNGEAVFLPDN